MLYSNGHFRVKVVPSLQWSSYLKVKPPFTQTFIFLTVIINFFLSLGKSIVGFPVFITQHNILQFFKFHSSAPVSHLRRLKLPHHEKVLFENKMKSHLWTTTIVVLSKKIPSSASTSIKRVLSGIQWSQSFHLNLVSKTPFSVPPIHVWRKNEFQYNIHLYFR